MGQLTFDTNIMHDCGVICSYSWAARASLMLDVGGALSPLLLHEDGGHRHDLVLFVVEELARDFWPVLSGPGQLRGRLINNASFKALLGRAELLHNFAFVERVLLDLG